MDFNETGDGTKMEQTPALVAPHGGYSMLKAFDKSDVVYLGTVLFCRRFLARHGDRTVDQMVQAARSCKQNLVEGSAASGTSKETEMRLTGVARASLDELLEDYRDHLHVRGWEEWPLSNPRKQKMRDWCHGRNLWSEYRVLLESAPADIFCNVMTCVIRQTQALIDGMLAEHERTFTEHGDFRDRANAVRSARRDRNWDDGVFKWLAGASSATILATREREALLKISSIASRLRGQRGWSGHTGTHHS